MQRSSDLLYFYSLLAAGLGSDGAPDAAAGAPHTPVPGDPGWQTLLQAGQGAQQPVQAAAEDVVAALVQRGWTPSELDSLPLGTALPLRAALLACRAQPPKGTVCLTSQALAFCSESCVHGVATVTHMSVEADTDCCRTLICSLSNCRRLVAGGVSFGGTRRPGSHERSAAAGSASGFRCGAGSGNPHRGLLHC